MITSNLVRRFQFAQFLIREISVRNSVFIERRPYPALILRARPRMHEADARSLQFVRLDQRVDGDGRALSIPGLSIRLEPRPVRVRNDERPSAPFASTLSESSSATTSSASLLRKRKAMSAFRWLLDEERRAPPVDPAGGPASVESSVMLCSRIALSFTGATLTLRMYCMVQPVSL